MATYLKTFLISLFLIPVMTGCSSLRDLSEKVQKPNLSVEDVRVTDFNFQQMELTYDVKVENPNAISLQMLAYDYKLDVNKNTLVQGDRKEKLRIEDSGESTIQVPMTLTFSDIYKTVQSFKNTDEVAYDFLSNLTFDIPVLGSQTLPVRKEGTIPLLKMPEISVEDFNIKSVSFNGADVNIRLRMNNPNGIGININSLNYDLFINGDQWAKGTALEGVSIKRNGVSELTVPISLKFSDMGMSAYRVLTNSEPFDYQVQGTFDLDIQHKLLGQTSFDFNRSGKLSLQ